MIKKQGHKRFDEKGQSMIEFTLSIVLLFSVTFFVIQMSIVLAWGNYIHYATFMSARALLSAGPAEGDQRTRAEGVITQMLKSRGNASKDRFAIAAKGEGGDTVKGMTLVTPDIGAGGGVDLSWQTGVRYTFKSRLFPIPLAGGGSSGSGGIGKVTLISESFLSRDPTSEECAAQMAEIGATWDNGC